MFHKAVQIAIPYAQELANKGITLGLPDNSHLALMVSNSLFSAPENTVPYSQFVETVQNVTVGAGTLTEHENISETLVEELAPLVQSHVSVARQIGALATSFAGVVQKYVEATPAEDPSGSFNIVTDELGNLFDESSVLGDLETSGTPRGYDGGAIASGPRDFDTLLGYLTTGRANIDKAIQQTVSQYADNFLENIWYGLFNSAMGHTSPYTLQNLNVIPSGERLAVTYIGYLMAQRLYENVPDDAVGNLSTFQSNVSNLRDHLLSLAGVALRQRHAQITDKVVVLSYNQQTRTVVVNGPIFREWLEQGGSSDIVLGALLSGGMAYTVQDLNTQGEKFNNQWIGYCSFHNAEYDVRRVQFMRSIYLVAMTESMSEIQGFEEGYRKEHPAHAEKVLTEVQNYVAAQSLDSLNDISKTSLELIAGIRFGYTPAKMILDSIDRTMKTTPDVDVREAALVASCSYVAKYLATQITANKA